MAVNRADKFVRLGARAAKNVAAFEAQASKSVNLYRREAVKTVGTPLA